MVYKRVEDLIGNTPLLELSRFAEKYSLKANVYAKLEFLIYLAMQWGWTFLV